MTYTSNIFRHSKTLKNASGLVRHHDHATIVRCFTSNASPSVDDTAWQYSSRRFPSQAKSDPKFRAINPSMAKMVGIREGNVTAGSAFTGRFSWSQLKAGRSFSTDSGYPRHQEIGMPSLSPTMQEDADKKGLSKISEYYEGGTFTVSNSGGPFGFGQFRAIINPPRAGMLAVGSVQKKVIPSSGPNQFKFTSLMHTLNKDNFKNGFSTFPTQEQRDTSVFISGARLVGDQQVRISLTKIYGIGRSKAVRLCSQLGISLNTKINELTKYQVHQIQQIVSQEHITHFELRRRVQAEIDRLVSIYCYRGIRHQDGLPLRGQRTHTNARTSRKFKRGARPGRPIEKTRA
jgi:small subunit ribosomal protein S13